MPTPTFCGSRTDSPHVGSSPTRAWVSAKRACSEAIRMSQYSASSSPPVTAAPLMAPITGLVIGGHCGEISGSCDESPSSLRSRPAQNTGVGAGDDDDIDVVTGLRIAQRAEETPAELGR